MKSPILDLLLAATLLFCGGCGSTKPVRDLGEATSLNAATLSAQMDQFARDQKALADQRIADIATLNQKVSADMNDRDRQLWIMKLSHKANQVDFLSNITTVAQSFADRQNALGQTAALRNAIRVKLTAIDTPATSLRGVSKDLDSLSHTPDLKQQAAEIYQFAQEVKQDVDKLQAGKTNALSATQGK